jgi:hypothetical protein
MYMIVFFPAFVYNYSNIKWRIIFPLYPSILIDKMADSEGIRPGGDIPGLFSRNILLCRVIFSGHFVPGFIV